MQSNQHYTRNCIIIILLVEEYGFCGEKGKNCSFPPGQTKTANLHKINWCLCLVTKTPFLFVGFQSKVMVKLLSAVCFDFCLLFVVGYCSFGYFSEIAMTFRWCRWRMENEELWGVAFVLFLGQVVSFAMALMSFTSSLVASLGNLCSQFIIIFHSWLCPITSVGALH